MPADELGWVGHRIGRDLSVERLVEVGGFATLYRAHHARLAGPVAVKCLRLEGRSQPRETLVEAFRQEGRLLLELARHTDGVVRVLDFDLEVSPTGAWSPYLVLEWLDGEDLDRRLAATGAFGIRGALSLLSPVAETLAVAHRLGVVHRDIKPANIFLAGDRSHPRVKVLDFGIAKVVGDLHDAPLDANTTSPFVAYSAPHAAPEQFLHARTGPWTDVYALALTFIEVATGRRPYGADRSAYGRVAADPFVRPSLAACGLPNHPRMDEVLARALAVDPALRPTDAARFWRDLSECEAPPVRGAASPPETLLGAIAPPLDVARTRDVTAPTGAAVTLTATGLVDPGWQPPAPPQPPPSPPQVALQPTEPWRPSGDRTTAPAVRRSDGPPRSSATVAVLGLLGVLVVFAAAYRLAGRSDAGDAKKSSGGAKTSSKKAKPTSTPQMVVIDGGESLVSAETCADPPTKNSFEGCGEPQRVNVEPFRLDRLEVTVADYRRCMNDGSCTAPRDTLGNGKCNTDLPGKADHPVNCVTWKQARAYCAWNGKRLPTLAEWETAAGAHRRKYPWGKDEPTCARATWGRYSSNGTEFSSQCFDEGYPSGTSPVGSSPANATPDGVLDLAGNVAEWVEDSVFYAKPGMVGPRRAAYGGSWFNKPEWIRSHWRFLWPEDWANTSTGIRCASD